ncbi:HAD family hydrolase [Amycolatopsis cihanbeyliensis]|uniref:2-haloacid dehalogenase n=1 Tax=Amycolatopsis cihanbeyliensis TaxID=1128664 RepID=A0A542DS71_AMYCI|nr:HAD family hydrolase [Amycolatopsis cihanbeyliensis]TQJ05854.1 2-haloacid dehalogenase [Amycolatopsis cihanbeyliensis]
MSELRWATFDCFGTLVDWRHGIATGAELLFPGHGAELLTAYNRHEPRVQAEFPAMRYREVLAEALRRACADAGLELLADDAAVLGNGIAHWPVFADTRAALAGLREAGWRLALLTNCDRDIIGESQRRLGVPVDAVVTAEDVGCYKPRHDHFTRFERTFGVRREHWVHVAQSYLHDIVPARELNIPRVWVNRLNEGNDPAIADAVLPGLNGLAETVGRVHAAAS